MVNIDTFTFSFLDNILIVDKNYKIAYSNRFGANNDEIFGDYTTSRLIGRNFFDAFPEFRTRESQIVECMKTGRTVIAKKQRCKDYLGRDYYTNSVAVPLMRRGTIIGVIELSMDVDEQDNAENSVSSQKFDEAVRRFQGGMVSSSFDSILTCDKDTKNTVEKTRLLADTALPILICGETGSGKEVFAQAIHQAGPRAREAFVAVNCSAFSKELLESELFGHRAGSFTGATKDKKGLFEEADKGTLFLDEIGEMPVELQAKLLRVLESGEFIKIGETRPTKVDLRIIAATNRDLEKEIAAGNFREDLYFRLSVFRIQLPALSQRREDVAEYARYFVGQFAAKMGKRIETIDDAYIAALERHTWHGNVRELCNVVERSLIMADGERLSADTLSPEFRAGAGAPPDSLALDALERHHILKVLEYAKGNKTEAARLLGIGIATLYRKLESYGVK